MKVFLIFGEHL